MKTIIRRAKLKDAEQIRLVLRRAHAKNTRLGIFFPAAAVTRKHLLSNMRKDAYYVLLYKKRIIGAVAVKHRGQQWHLGSLGLLANCRKRGYGSRLLHFGERKIKARGGARVILLTPQMHPCLPKYYRRHGYRKLRTIRLNHINWLVMRKKLY